MLTVVVPHSASGDTSWRGRGLLIIERTTEEFELVPHAAGTRISMRWPVLAATAR